ncbi:MAG: sigma-70 family RNA polymerase sigma factor [Ruminococcus sp.]|nr:sigma-70 family RNA polymerase sigma factor [Ruminococcus sp.]
MEIKETTDNNKSLLTFDEVYKKYYRQILAYFIKHIGNQEEAEDLTSEVFMYCYKNFDKYDVKKASVSTWIYLIAKSRFCNYLRDRKVNDNIDDYTDLVDYSAVDVDKALYLEEMRKQLNNALNSLTERQRLIVILKYFQEKSAEEIALILNTNANNIRVQLSKALKSMKKNGNWS